MVSLIVSPHKCLILETSLIGTHLMKLLTTFYLTITSSVSLQIPLPPPHRIQSATIYRRFATRGTLIAKYLTGTILVFKRVGPTSKEQITICVVSF